MASQKQAGDAWDAVPPAKQCWEWEDVVPKVWRATLGMKQPQGQSKPLGMDVSKSWMEMPVSFQELYCKSRRREWVKHAAL